MKESLAISLIRLSTCRAATTKQSGKAYKAAGTAAIAAERGKQQFYKRSYMHRPGVRLASLSMTLWPLARRRMAP
jgi:hypothetical protein